VTGQLSLFPEAAPRARWIPGKVYRYPWGSMIHCFSNPKVPHGEGHNAVCVCMCEDCTRERAEGPPGRKPGERVA
jgi:hypothetical protein